MARLLAGTPEYTGVITKENLYKEARVSRATMNRATGVLAEWDARVAGHGRRTPGEARRDSDLEKAEKKLKAKTAEAAELRKRLDAAATVIAALHHDNQALREHLNSRVATVAGLDERRAHHIPGESPAAGPC